MPAAVAALTTVGWFRPGRFVAAGDVSPFVRGNLAGEWWSLWTHQLSGAGSTSYETGRAVEVALLAFTHMLGLSGVVAQWLLLAGCCALAALGSAYFAATWCRRPWLVACAGGFGAFNSLQLVNVPNVLPAVAIGTAGLMGGLLLRRAAGADVGSRRLVATSLPLAYLSLNPPLLLVVLGWCVAVVGCARWLAGPKGTRRAALLALRSLPLGMLLNAWWLLPFAVAVFAPAGITFAAQTDVQAWAWSQARNSVGNVLALNAHWGWSQPDYFPYAAQMDTKWEAWARWVLPALAILGVLRPPRSVRRPARWLGAALVALVFIGKGLHGPGGNVNLWLYDHLPGLWLLREPMSKIGPLLVLVEAALAVLAIDRLLTDVRGRERLGRLGRTSATVALLAALAYPWPLWTGAVIADNRIDLPPSHVSVPSGWYDVAAAVNSRGGTGSTLVLPLDPFYQVTTSWGYHGVDDVPQQLLDRPVLRQLPGGYFADNAGLAALYQGVQRSLLAGDAKSVRRRLEALGVTTVIVRHDLVQGPADVRVADDTALDRGMAATAGGGPFISNNLASAYRLDGPARVRGYGDGLLAVEASSPDLLSASVAAAPSGVATTTDRSIPVDGLTWQVEDRTATSRFVLDAAGRYGISRPTTAPPTYRPSVQVRPHHRWRVVLSDASRVRLDGAALPGAAPITLPAVRQRPVALSVNGRLVRLEHGASVRLPKTARIVVLTKDGRPRRLRAPDGTGNCDNRSGSDAGVSADASPTGVRLRAERESACAWWEVGDVGTGGPLLVSVRGSTDRGAAGRACLWQPVEQRCAQLVSSRTGADSRWLLGDVGRTRRDQLFVYADATPGGTTASYRAPVVRPLTAQAATTVAGPSVGTVVRRLDAGPHVVTFDSGVRELGLQPMSGVEDCNAGGGAGAATLRATPIPHGVQLAAAADSACAWTEPTAPTVASRYHLSLQYRTVAGQPARLCVWEVGPDECADTPSLPPARQGWRTFTADVVADPRATALRLYVYADGQAAPRTVTDYRNLSLRPESPFVMTVTKSSTPSTGRLDLRSTCGAATCHVDVTGAEGRFVIGFSDSFAPGWQLTGLPAGWRARHIELDGYSNGWLVDGHGAAALTISYGPERMTERSVLLSTGLGLALLLGWGLPRRLRRRRRGRHI